MYEGQSNKNRTPATKWQWHLFYSKVIAKSVNPFIPLGDETINSSLVQRGRSLIDPQLHPFLHFLVRMKPTSTNVFLRIAKNVEVTREKIWTARRMLECFPVNSLKLITHQIGNMGTVVIMRKDDSVRQHSRAFWLYGACSSNLSHQGTTALLSLPPFLMLDEHILHYAHLQSNKETTVWICAFSLCMSPTLKMAVSIRKNSVARFCVECFLAGVRFSFDCPS